VASRIRNAMEYFFDADKPHWTAWSRVQKIDVWWTWFTPDKRMDAFPLYYASLGGFYDVTEHLVGKHPEHANAEGGWMVSPLVAALRGNNLEIAELLHRHGAVVDVRGALKSTLLGVTCACGALDIAQWLLDHGAAVNTQDKNLDTPLHDAAFNRQLEGVQILIQHNADVHIRNHCGATPLHVAAGPRLTTSGPDHVDIMRVLLDHGADPNAQDDDCSTPLHYSSWRDNKGYNPEKGTVEGTRLLLKHGAIIDAEDNEGRTPLQLALNHGRDDVVTCLKEHGATR